MIKTTQFGITQVLTRSGYSYINKLKKYKVLLRLNAYDTITCKKIMLWEEYCASEKSLFIPIQPLIYLQHEHIILILEQHIISNNNHNINITSSPINTSTTTTADNMNSVYIAEYILPNSTDIEESLETYLTIQSQLVENDNDEEQALSVSTQYHHPHLPSTHTRNNSNWMTSTNETVYQEYMSDSNHEYMKEKNHVLCSNRWLSLSNTTDNTMLTTTNKNASQTNNNDRVYMNMNIHTTIPHTSQTNVSTTEVPTSLQSNTICTDVTISLTSTFKITNSFAYAMEIQLKYGVNSTPTTATTTTRWRELIGFLFEDSIIGHQ